MSAQTAATRLRRTFQYPSESDDEDAVEAGMDEQDQAALLTTLTTHDTHTTHLYTHILLALPLLPILLYTPLLLHTSTMLPALAAIPSLLATAYTLYFLPLPPVRINILHLSDLQDGRRKPRTQAGSGDANAKAERPRVPWVSEEVAEMLARWIVPMNGFLCAVLAALEVAQGRNWGEGVSVGGGFLPGVVWGVVMAARRELRAVDMSELARLKASSKNT